MEVKHDVDAEQLADWLDDHSMYASGYVDAGWSYDGDDGRTLHVIES